MGSRQVKDFLERQVRGGVEVQRHAVVLGVHDTHLVGWLVGGDRGAIVEEGDARLVDPLAKNQFERVVATAQELVERLVVKRGRALECDFESFVTVVDVGYIALLGQFDALAIRKLHESPEKNPGTGRLAAMEAIGASLLAHVLRVEIRLPPSAWIA